MRSRRRQVKALIAVCIAGSMVLPASAVSASDGSTPASPTSQPERGDVLAKLREVLKALDAMPKTEQRTEVRTRVAAAISRFEAGTPLSLSELDELMKAVRAVMPTAPGQPPQSPATSQPSTPGAGQPAPQPSVPGTPGTRPGTSQPSTPGAGQGSGTSQPPKPGEGQRPGTTTPKNPGAGQGATPPSSDQTKPGTTKPEQRDDPAAALQRALTLLSALPQSADVDAAKTRVSDLLSRVQRGEKPTRTEMEEVSKTLAALLGSAGSKPVPGSSPTGGSQPGEPPQTGPQQSTPSSGARPDLGEQLMKVSAVLQTLPQSTERDALIGEVNTLIANLRAGMKPASGEVQRVMGAAAVMLKNAGGAPSDAVEKKQPSAEQIRAKVTEIMESALRRLAEAPEGSDPALVAAAKTQAEAVLAKVTNGETPAKTEVDAVIAAVQAALGGAKNIRASFALSGAIAAMEASKAPAEVKTRVTEILREAMAKVENSDASPEEQEAIVRDALEQARAARLAAMTEKLTEVASVLMAEAERVGDQNSVVAVYAALSMITPEGGEPTRESLNEARMLLGDVARRLGVKREDEETPREPGSADDPTVEDPSVNEPEAPIPPTPVTAVAPSTPQSAPPSTPPSTP